MSRDELEKVQEIVADGVAAEGLQGIVLTAEESAARRRQLVNHPSNDTMSFASGFNPP